MSLPTLFGNLGGLYEFLASAIMLLIGSFQISAFQVDRVREHFRIPISATRNLDLSQGLPSLGLRDKMFSKVKESLSQQLRLSFWSCVKCVASKRERQRKALLEAGEAKLERALDTRALIQLQRAFRSLLRLQHSQATRTLIKHQRIDTVLELPNQRHDDAS